MKLLLFLLLTIMSFFSYSQDSTYSRQKIYKISIARTNAKFSSGYIAAIKDSSIWLTTDVGSIRNNSLDEKYLKKIHFSYIERVVIRRKGTTGRGIAYGALIGFATGAITGFIMGDDPPCDSNSPFGGFCALRMTAGEKAVILGGAGIGGGAIVGGIIGSVVRKKFTIGGKKEKFDNMKWNVLDKMYGKQKNNR